MIFNTLKLAWPENNFFSHKILPIFIPFAGCARKCIFCAQNLQTGLVENDFLHNNNIKAVNDVKETTKTTLKSAFNQLQYMKKIENKQLEIAFYGGTFTALPQDDFQLCCQFVKKMFDANYISRARCSTRPDTINLNRLNLMKKVGFTCIELGVQSFDSSALQLVKRDYDAFVIQKACKLIKSYDFSLGIQLMPGMPGVDAHIFLMDTEQAIAMQSDFLRFYPCQVIANTELATIWHNGEFVPWSLEHTIDTLSTAWLKTHLANIPVIRMGLAPEPLLDEHILAGPRHEALGNLVQSQALYQYIKHNISDKKIISLNLPHSCQGYFWGHKKNLSKAWAKFNIQKQNVTWHDEHYISIITE